MFDYIYVTLRATYWANSDGLDLSRKKITGSCNFKPRAEVEDNFWNGNVRDHRANFLNT